MGRPAGGEPRLFAVVPAAGKGRRFGGEIPKQYLPLCGKPVLQHTLERLLAFRKIERLVLVLAPEDPFWPELPLANHPKIGTAVGGRERAESVLAGLKALEGEVGEEEWVAVHDAARPLVDRSDLERLLEAAGDDPVGAILALPVVDTLKEVSRGRIVATLDRSRIFRAQTPQLFRYGLLRRALESALVQGVWVTDEASAVERLGGRPRVVEGRERNLKITRPEDLRLAEFFLRERCG